MRSDDQTDDPVDKSIIHVGIVTSYTLVFTCDKSSLNTIIILAWIRYLVGIYGATTIYRLHKYPISKVTLFHILKNIEIGTGTRQFIKQITSVHIKAVLLEQFLTFDGDLSIVHWRKY